MKVNQSKLRGNGRPSIVEIVGPAGAGKSTLSRLLRERDDTFVPDPKLRLKGIKHIPVFVRSAVPLLPILTLERGQGRPYTWKEFKKVVYLRAWESVLKRLARSNGAVIVDQGPVFELATLYGLGPERLKRKGFDDWWESMFRLWADSLDLLVCLDADDEILIPRICSREVWHVVKGSSEDEAREFLSRYREAYRHVVSELKAKGGMDVLRFDTSAQPMEDVVNRVMDALRRHVPLDAARPAIESTGVET